MTHKLKTESPTPTPPSPAMLGLHAAGAIKDDRHFVSALARGLRVLSSFRSGEEMLGNHEIARRAGLPKSTISRLTYTLTKLGYLQYCPDNVKYRLGTATLALGSAMLARLDIRQLARPLMQELANFSAAMVSLGVRERFSMIYIENCRSQSALTLSLDVGSRIPIATTAMGRAYIALMPEAERNELLAEIAARDSTQWPRIRAGVETALEQQRELSCCCSFGDWQEDVNAIAVAFHPGRGLPPMSINCGGPAFHLAPDFLLTEARPRLLDVVRRLQLPQPEGA